MTDKVYIVANKEQEIEVLKKLERKGLLWRIGMNATDFVPSKNSNEFGSFPYAIMEKEFIIWAYNLEVPKGEIVFDGRKEEKMYKVTQEFMNELIEWRDNYFLNATDGKSHHYIDHDDLDRLPDVAEDWRFENENAIERNNRLIAIIQWLNGEDVFEVEEPHKFVVRSDKKSKSGDYIYVEVSECVINGRYRTPKYATKFDTREEAQEWANSHQVVVEIDADGNEVE